MSRLLAIDPGYDRCGVALVEDGNPLTIIYSACITTDKKDSQELRLAHIYKELTTVLSTWKPHAIALETLFFSVNKKTAIKVAEARGAVLLVAGIHRLPLVELSPQEVKLCMTGTGNATKEQVQKMVSLSLSMDISNKLDDEVDAMALGVAALQKWNLSCRTEKVENPLAKKK